MVARFVLLGLCAALLAGCGAPRAGFTDPLPGPAQTTVTHPMP